MKGLIGRKLGMASVFAEDGTVEPVTLIECGPCFVTQVKSVSTDGYRSVQLGFDEISARKVSGGVKGHLGRNELPGLRILREFRVGGNIELEEGQKLTADVFDHGDYVDVTGKSKGKGFQGVVKRYNFKGVGDATHGQHNRLRAPGSIGAASYPARVFKGMRMAGQMGNARVSVDNLEVLKVLADKNMIVVKGAVPGSKNSYITIEK